MPKNIKTEDIINGLVRMKLEKNASNKTLLDFLMKDLGYSQPYSYTLLQKARKKIQEVYHQKMEEQFEISKGQLEEMLEKATTKKDFKLALQIIQEINKMCGVYAAEKVDMTVTEYKAKFGE